MTDRAVKFGFRDALDYQIIVNWVIAAHKSQGAFQMDMNRADREEFVVLESGAADEAADAAADAGARPRAVSRDGGTGRASEGAGGVQAVMGANSPTSAECGRCGEAL